MLGQERTGAIGDQVFEAECSRIRDMVAQLKRDSVMALTFSPTYHKIHDKSGHGLSAHYWASE